MRDLKTTDRVSKDFRSILDEHGCVIPIAFNGLKDWARWWIRQAEMHEFIRIPREQREVFNRILSDD